MGQVQVETTSQTTQVTFENPKIRMLKEMLQRFLQNKLAIMGGIITILIILMAIFAQWVSPHDPAAQNYEKILAAPSAEHLFGTDQLGRDILTRVIYGAQVSVKAGLISVGIALSIGIPIGLISGYYRGVWDEYIIMRFTDAMLSFPTLVLALALAAVLGAGLENAMLAIGLVFTPNIIRLIRAEVLSHREREYVEAAKASGISDFRIIIIFNLFDHHLITLGTNYCRSPCCIVRVIGKIPYPSLLEIALPFPIIRRGEHSFNI